MVRLSLPMNEALELRAEREGVPAAAVATAVLRSGLQRTMDSAECMERISRRRAEATLEERMFDLQVESGEVARREGTAG